MGDDIKDDVTRIKEQILEEKRGYTSTSTLHVDERVQFDEVEKASHYNMSPAQCKNCGHQIECIDVIRHMVFNVGTIIKYLWRAGLKPGNDHLKDLKKAQFYLEDEIARAEGKSSILRRTVQVGVVKKGECVDLVQVEK